MGNVTTSGARTSRAWIFIAAIAVATSIGAIQAIAQVSVPIQPPAASPTPAATSPAQPGTQPARAPATPPTQPAQKPVAVIPPAATPATSTAASAAPVDPVMATAESLIGRALFLRGFYSANDLSYDAGGKLESNPNSEDWTLAGINVLKANRNSPTQIELEGVRVSIRYNPDAHEFQRHPMNDEKMKVLVKLATGTDAVKDARQERAAFAAIFSQGIDPRMQAAMPPMWKHYFDPNLTWGQDALAGQTVYPMFGLPDQPKDVIPPALSHKTDASLTGFAQRDKVKGPVQMRMVIDSSGVPQRLSVTKPLGYGLDERAGEAMAKWRFTPAMRAGQPVASGIVVNLDFEYIPPPPK